MAFTPVAGNTALLKVKPANGNNTTMACINWTGQIDAKVKDVSNFRDGRFRVATLQDSTWNFTVVHDAGAPEYLAANGSLIDGQVCTLLAYVGNNGFYSVPGIITNVSPKNEGVEGVIMHDVTISQHNGVVTYPTT